MTRNNKALVGSEVNGIKIVGYWFEGSHGHFTCICVCGKEFQSRCDHIKSGRSKSCGCLTSELVSVGKTKPDNESSWKTYLRWYEQNAKRRHIDFSLSRPKFESLAGASCYYCGTPPTSKQVRWANERGVRDRFLVCNGIDRVDNTVGYIESNCVPCCETCNKAKGTLTTEEFRTWVQKVAQWATDTLK